MKSGNHSIQAYQNIFNWQPYKNLNILPLYDSQTFWCNESKTSPTHTTRTYTRSGGAVPFILNSALNGGEWSAQRPGPLCPLRKSTQCPSKWMWVGPRAGLGVLQKSKISSPAGTLTPDHPTYSLVTITTTLSRVPFLRVYNKLHGWKLGVLLLYISALYSCRGEEEENNVPNVPRESTGWNIAVLNRQICPNLKWPLLSKNTFLPAI